MAHWVESATLLSCEGRVVKIGLPQSETAARDNIMRDSTKKYLEEVCQSLLGRAVQLQVVLDANIQVNPHIEAPAPAPVTAKPAPAKVEDPKPAPITTSKDDLEDPLIQKAVEKFKATLLAS